MREHFPQHPLYVVSKGRSQYMMTSTTLTEMGVQHFIVVEPQEGDAYRAAVSARGLATTVIELDMSYKKSYESCDALGQTRGTGPGPGPARNFAWEHSIDSGAPWHWVMDDNISHFLRLHRNRRIKCVSPGLFRAMEDYSARYVNVAMAGPNYDFFVMDRQKNPPIYRNTRIYSCNLIRNDAPFRWRGRYNEDTILSLDMLKAGWCTIEFNAFLQHKMQTQAMGGGNTAEFYHREGVVGQGRYADGGTTAKSEMLVKVHPDVAKVTWRFGRVHHKVNYRPFRKNRLILCEGAVLPQAPNNYGMSLRTL
ncbi:MAG: hypothetical protein IPJ08_18415 [Burkholderiales bacterium]|nr:hypothetical protein [Burkholderiales bacterium]